MSNQAIDLSQVRIVSCREYDLHLLKKEREFMKKVLYHHDIYPSDPSQSECDSSDSEKKLGYVSGPLAVVDHGPVFEFKKKVDSSCNLLNEMYNIGSLKNMDGSKNSVSPLLDSKKRTISSPFNLLDGKRQNIREKALELKCGVEQTYLTMEEAVSFSPFARVIFDAEPPHTIVHINAAYGSLVSQHIVSASFVGQTLGDLSQINGSKDISAMVASHLQKIAPSLPPYQIFPVVSRLSDFRIFHAFRRLQCLGSPVMASIPPVMNYDNESLPAAGAKVIGNGSERDIDFVAYYMLQIESKSQIRQSPCPHNK